VGIPRGRLKKQHGNSKGWLPIKQKMWKFQRLGQNPSVEGMGRNSLKICGNSMG
jgi:hypothetical protein